MTVKLRANDADSIKIRQIADRAMKLSKELGVDRDKLSLTMDMTACHLNGNPLRLDDLINADDFNFCHDVFGIERHMDRGTGRLLNCFRPRFSAHDATVAA